MRLPIFLLSITLISVVACGQSGGGSGTMAEGGIGGSGISNGPITDFGSIFVNDIEWFLDEAVLRLEGEDFECDSDAECQAPLRLGMVVRVEGRLDSDGQTGQADRVYFDDEIEGPISAIDEVTDIGIPGQYRELTVLGMKVRIEAGVTRFDDDDDKNNATNFGFDTIEVDDVVEISGLVDVDGVIYATYVELEGTVEIGTTEVELKGTVEGLAPGGSTFTIGSVTIDFDPTGVETDLSDVPGGVLDNGDYVEVEGVITAADRIDAKEIELEDDGDEEEDREDFSITGFVGGFTSLDELFFVGNQQVDGSSAEFEHGTPEMLENGRRVEVEGDIVDGVLIADEIEFEDQEIEIHAEIVSADDIDAANGRLVLLGIEVQILPSTQFEDDRDDEEPFGLGDLEVGDFVEIEAVANAQGTVTAFEVERDETDSVRLRGPLEEFDADTGEVVVLGVRVPTDGFTSFEIDDFGVDAQTFFDEVSIGDFVEIKDDTGSATEIDVATEVELENEEDDD